MGLETQNQVANKQVGTSAALGLAAGFALLTAPALGQESAAGQPNVKANITNLTNLVSAVDGGKLIRGDAQTTILRDTVSQQQYILTFPENVGVEMEGRVVKITARDFTPPDFNVYLLPSGLLTNTFSLEGAIRMKNNVLSESEGKEIRPTLSLPISKWTFEIPEKDITDKKFFRVIHLLPFPSSAVTK